MQFAFILWASCVCDVEVKQFYLNRWWKIHHNLSRNVWRHAISCPIYSLGKVESKNSLKAVFRLDAEIIKTIQHQNTARNDVIRMICDIACLGLSRFHRESLLLLVRNVRKIHDQIKSRKVQTLSIFVKFSHGIRKVLYRYRNRRGSCWNANFTFTSFTISKGHQKPTVIHTTPLMIDLSTKSIFPSVSDSLKSQEQRKGVRSNILSGINGHWQLFLFPCL